MPHSDEATVNHWRGAVTWLDSDLRSLSVELDRNLGGMWPRVVVHAEARPIEGSAVRVAPSGVAEETYLGAHGFEYSVGVPESLVKALLSGALEGLESREGFEIRITSCAVAVDSAETVAHHAAQVAASLLCTVSGRAPELSEVLAACERQWV